MEGWIKLHRSVLSHRLFQEKEVYDRKSAFIYLLLTVNHRESFVDIEGETYQVKRGSMITSVKKLSDIWRWSRNKVNAFLDECIFNGEISVERQQRMTIIYVLNYEKYQGTLLEIEFKQGQTFGQTFGHTKKTDLNPVNTRDSEQSRTYQKDILSDRLSDTNNNKDKEIYKNTLSFISETIAYLNQKAGTRYRVTVAKTKALIQARMKEGFTLDDFKTVIDVKVVEWVNDSKMSKFLRPETLFGNKFESYLNQAPKKEVKNELPMFTLSQEDVEYYERLQ